MPVKIKTITADKYDGLSNKELKEKLVKLDTKKAKEEAAEDLDGGKTLRLASNAGTSLLTGVIYARKPSARNIMGTPLNLDHLKAVLGGVGTFMSDDDPTSNALEGIAHSGIAPASQQLGEYVSSLLPS